MLNRPYFLILAPLIFLLDSGLNATVYVSQNAPGPVFNGASWQTAYQTLTQALAQPALTGQVWVAQGVYTGNHAIPANVAVYGGFAGNEASLTSRNPAQHRSVLDGNQSGSVVTIKAGSRIDGFTIRNGKASSGGGVSGGSPAGAVIANNIIENNSALSAGGGIYIETVSTPSYMQIQGNTVRRNTSLGKGGGIAIYQTSHSEAESPQLYDNVIRDNTATSDGGGIWAYFSTPHIERCSVWNNTAGRNGGGIFIYHSYATIVSNHVSRNIANSTTGGGGGLYVDFHSIPMVADNTFEYNKAFRGGASWQEYQTQAIFVRNLVVANIAEDGGGGLYTAEGAAPEVSNNLFLRNKAAIGGAACVYRPASSPNFRFIHNTVVGNSATSGGALALQKNAGAVIKNNIFSGNTGIDAAIFKDPSASPSITYNDFWQSSPVNIAGAGDPVGSNGNISANPDFENPLIGLFQVKANSPCIDSCSVMITLAIDHDNRTRPIDGDNNGSAVSDMGAYEYGAGPLMLTGMRQAYELAPGTQIAIPYRVVNGVTDNAFFVQDPDRKQGLKITSGGPPASAQVVTVTGTLSDTLGYRTLSAGSWTGTNTAFAFSPPIDLALPNIADQIGLNTVGLVVSATGRVESLESDGFWLGIGGTFLARVYCDSSSRPTVGKTCTVTGTVDWDGTNRILRTRTRWDIVIQN